MLVRIGARDDYDDWVVTGHRHVGGICGDEDHVAWGEVVVHGEPITVPDLVSSTDDIDRGFMAGVDMGFTAGMRRNCHLVKTQGVCPCCLGGDALGKSASLLSLVGVL